MGASTDDPGPGESADALFERVAEMGDEDSAYALLDEFFRGYPVERVGELVQSPNEDVVRAGAWIASELGALSEPVLHLVAPLLDHAAREVRFAAIDTILCAAGAAHGTILAAAAGAILDPDEPVRWKAMTFLTQATTEQLAAAQPYAGEDSVAASLNDLVRLDEDAAREWVGVAIDSDDGTRRLIGGVAAARLAPQQLTYLKTATQSNDPLLASFALEQLRHWWQS